MSLPQPSNPEKSIDALANRATLAALITGQGRSAIAVIGIHGPSAMSWVQTCFRPATAAPLLAGQIRYGVWSAAAGLTGESVVVTPIANDRVEVHCHGGAAAIQRILQQLCDQGATIVDRQRYAKATTAGGLMIAEATAVLCECLTARCAATAMDQVRGALSAWVDQSIRKLDATKQDEPVSDGPDTITQQANQMIDRAALTTRLADRFRVVLLGHPNAGKSSLINAIVGYDRSITTDIPGTTRDVLDADTVIDGFPVRFSDTAGIRSSDDPIEQQGIAKARTAASDADLVIRVFELSEPAPPAPENVAALDVINKIDLATDEQRLAIEHDLPAAQCVSALVGTGIDGLMSRLAEIFSAKYPDRGQPAVINSRQLELMQQVAAATDPPSQRNALIKFRQE